MKAAEVKIGQQIFLVLENKIVTVKVTSIQTQQIFSVADSDEVTTTVKARASLSRLCQHKIVLIDDTFYETREQLVEYLYEHVNQFAQLYERKEEVFAAQEEPRKRR